VGFGYQLPPGLFSAGRQEVSVMRSLFRALSFCLICLLFIASIDVAANGSLGGGGLRAVSLASVANQKAPGAGEMLRQHLHAASGTEVLNGPNASGVKLTDPRNETCGNTASERPRKEFGYWSWRSLVTAQGGPSVNLALGRPATQSSNFTGATTAGRAVDGNTNGNVAANSVSITAGFEHQPWWQVDLGRVQQIETVKLWNRTDCCGQRLSNFYVLVSNNPFSSTDLLTTINQAGVSSYYTADPVGTAKEIGVYRNGMYVRVQLAGDDYLQLAEVEVLGAVSGASCAENVPADRWKGEYFNNTSLTGSPAMVRDDGAGFLSFNWGGGGPGAACGLAVDNFSARWTRTVNFAASAYRFSVTGDDGVRLYVDGQLKIDKWFSQGATTYAADVTLSAGNHEVKLEYFEGGGPGVAFLSWADATGVNCLPNAPLPLISSVSQASGRENVASTAPSQAPKRCGQKNSD
jgi:PA14 domain/F5/8 type C domain